MLARVQLDCLEQGSLDSTNWSTRTLTIDTHTATLTISRCNHPANMFYHTLKLSTVQLWPHFCADATHDDFNSIEAKRTLCIFGTTAAVPDFTEEEVALVAIPLPLSAEGETAVMRHLLQVQEQHHLVYPLIRTDTVHNQRRTTLGGYDAWILRFPSKALYDVAVRMLRGWRMCAFRRAAC